MTEEQPDEKNLLANLAQVVVKEKELSEKLVDLQFDPQFYGFERFDITHIQAFRALVTRHQALIDKLTPEHLRVSLDDLKDVTQKIIADFQSSDTVIQTLTKFKKAARHHSDLLSQSARELHEKSMQLKWAAIPDMALADVKDGYNDAIMQQESPEEMRARELHLILTRVLNVEHQLKKLHGQRWWDGSSPSRTLPA